MEVNRCAVCERTLLLGERSFRFAPDGVGEVVEVCQLCQETALGHGWVREGSPVGPAVGSARRRRALSLAGIFGGGNKRPAPEAYVPEPTLRRLSNEEHAMVDGCSKIGAMIRILLPLSAPGIVASAIFSFTLAWNEFLLALVFTVDQSTMTVPIKLSMMVVGDQYIWGQLMAGAILASIPIAILYFIGQRFVVQGLAAGAVKG